MRANGLQLRNRSNVNVVGLVLVLVLLALVPAVAHAQVEIHATDSYPVATPAPPPPPPYWNTVRVTPRPMPIPAPEDPASTRLSLFNTADTLRQGEWSLTWREFATVEVAVGLTDWLEMNIRTIPILMFVPEGGAVNSLWSGGLRLRMLKSSYFTLTSELEAGSFLGWAGLRGGVTAKLGNDRFAFHAGVSGLWMWEASDESWLKADVDYIAAPRCTNSDCGTVSVESDETPSMASVLPTAGLTIRLHRRVKLLTEVAYISAADTMLVTPAIRLHGKRFACDLGLMVIYDTEARGGLILPVVNMSVRF
jgi:hypothetical protein